MKPSNQFTSPEQRFFLPDRLEEAECHFSINMHDIPNVHLMEGEFGYSIVETSEGEKVGYLSETEANIPSGSLVKSVVTTDASKGESKFYQKPQLRPEDDPDDKEKIENRAEGLEVHEGDLLVLGVNVTGLPKDNYVRRNTDRNNIMLWPAELRLPFSNGWEEESDSSQEMKYKLLGVIHNQDLVGWRSANGIFLRHVVDLSVANELSENPLERAVVAHQLRINRSLLSLLRTNETAAAYLRYFDELKGTDFTPLSDPQPVSKHLEQMTPEQIERYEKVLGFIRDRL